MASAVLSFKRKTQVAVANSMRQPTVRIGNQSFELDDLNPTLKRFTEFWDLMDTVKRHGYIRAAMSVVGRSTVGAWWSLRRHPEYGKGAPDRHRKRLYSFYNMDVREWDNIKDFQNVAYKIMIGAMYLKYFGQAAYQILRDKGGAAVGLDFLPGLVVPNVDSSGKFKSPAFVQYPDRDPSVKVEFGSPRDVVYLVNPDWEGSPMGGSDVEALTTYTLPLDLYLQLAAREYMKNRDKPEVVYSLPQDISDEAFDEFVEMISARHSGAVNLGRNPVVVQGDFSVHELRDMPDKLPYQQSREQAMEEELAVTGVSGAKLGVSKSLSSANLREMRREFHETSMVPLFRLIETAFYEQIHVREFGYKGWEFRFNNPDFLNAVERATVHMRYHDMGVFSPNEIRHEIGKEPRKDPEGDQYIDQPGEEDDDDMPENPQGSPPEGRPMEPDDPSQIGEPTIDDQDPPRGDQHNDTPRQSMLRELRRWKRFAVRRAKQGKPVREFNTEFLPGEVRDIVRDAISKVSSAGQVSYLFDEVINEFEEALDAEE